ncbi:hypothetical protein CJJ19_03020 [Candidatus Williamhamiltonella defendens]|uniref:hypothetical protein n=1 Tax=Candidatus Williamhamiltonella defendens TaxID=138072 RepID=UPI0012AA8590|nr:hypothetical protein [Candidatus Hamiltonella defensa]AYB48624.1 hypothetical protein CJJ19_03020 [Candidatus Hamiltonella defensa]
MSLITNTTIRNILGINVSESELKLLESKRLTPTSIKNSPRLLKRLERTHKKTFNENKKVAIKTFIKELTVSKDKKIEQNPHFLSDKNIIIFPSFQDLKPLKIDSQAKNIKQGHCPQEKKFCVTINQKNLGSILSDDRYVFIVVPSLNSKTKFEIISTCEGQFSSDGKRIGHVSLAMSESGRLDVYYAGMFEVENGNINNWSNESGHYKTDMNIHKKVARYMSAFPPEKFKEFR